MAHSPIAVTDCIEKRYTEATTASGPSHWPEGRGYESGDEQCDMIPEYPANILPVRYVYTMGVHPEGYGRSPVLGRARESAFDLERTSAPAHNLLYLEFAG